MTSNSEKLRSLFLTALMVFSVFAGTVALSGSAAAVSGNSSFETLSPDSAASGTTVTHDYNITFTDVTPDGGGDDITVTLPSSASFDTDGTNTVNVMDGDGNSISLSSSPSFADANGGTDNQLTFQIQPDSSTQTNETLFVSGQVTVEFPTVSSQTTAPVSATLSDSEDGSSETVSTPVTIEAVSGTALNSGDTVYSGQDVYVTGLDSTSQYRVRELNDDNQPGTLRQRVNAGSDGVIEFELSDELSDGDFVIVNDDGDVIPINNGVAQTPESPNESNTLDADFEVITQDLTAEFDDASTGNDGSSATVDYEIDSDLRTDYDVNISAQGDLDVDDLNDIFGDANTTMEYDDEDTVTVVGQQTYELNFTDIDAGTYTFEANVTDTGASDADDIEVTDTGDSSAEFSDNVYTNQVGDIVNITVEMQNTDTATLQVGEQSNSGYSVTAEVVDDDEDGVAYVEFNSFTAASGETVLTPGDDDTTVDNVNQAGSFNGSNVPVGSDVLENGDYNMFVIADEYDGSGQISGDVSRATLDLSPRTTESLDIWTAPEGELDELQDTDAAGISEYATANNLTRTDTIAENDTVVVQVSASGLEGALAGDETQLYNDTSAEGRLFNLSFERQTGSLNTDGEVVDISQIGTSNFSVVYDAEGDSHYVVIDGYAITSASEFEGYDDGDEYKANFTVFGNDGGNDIADDTQSVNSTFAVDEAELELDTNADDEIILEAASGQEVSGTTNLAPGTEVEVVLDSETSGDPFVKYPNAIVQQDGSYTAVADFSENQPGSEFTAEARVDNIESDSFDGRLTESTQPEVTPDNNTATETETETETETVTETETTTDSMVTTTEAGGAGTATEEATTGGSGPGFTAALALIALVAAALLAVRRDN